MRALAAALLVATAAAAVSAAALSPPAPLHVLTYGRSANGFAAPPRGWNAWALIANHQLNQTQQSVTQQCGALGGRQRGGPDVAQYCSLDSGWSVGCNGDAHGRPIPDATKFPSFAALGEQLRAGGSRLGVYVIPGTFTADRDKLIHGTNITLGSTWAEGRGSKFCRREFNFSRPGVQQWHNSVVDMLCEEFHVGYIKLDYICPTGSPDGCQGFADSQPAVAMYHAAIQQSRCNGTMRLGISWMLDWNQKYFPSWSSAADSMRLDEDINNSGEATLVRFGTVQRAIERYRVFVTSLAQGLVNGNAGREVHIRPDMDSTFLANPLALSGLHDAQRHTMAMHWIGAGANLLEGGDLLQVDSLGEKLLYDPLVYGPGGIVEQFAAHPMQPRNPRPPTTGSGCEPHWPWSAGGGSPQQLQAWISGPNVVGDALVVLSNLGPDERPRTGPHKSGTFLTQCQGAQSVRVSFEELGLLANQSYHVDIVWDGRPGGRDHTTAALAVNLTREFPCSFSVQFDLQRASSRLQRKPTTFL
jgi:alpha-galactosidase